MAKLLALLSLNLPNIGTWLQPDLPGTHTARAICQFSLIFSPSKTGSPMGRPAARTALSQVGWDARESYGTRLASYQFCGQATLSILCGVDPSSDLVFYDRADPKIPNDIRRGRTSLASSQLASRAIRIQDCTQEEGRYIHH